MDRGRSPSVGRSPASAHHSPSPSAQTGFNPLANARGTDPVLLQSSNFSASFSNDANHNQGHPSLNDSSYLGADYSQFAQDSNQSNPGWQQDPSHHFKDSFPSSDNFGLSPHNVNDNSFLNPAPSTGVDPSFLDVSSPNSATGFDSALSFDSSAGSAGENQHQSQNPADPSSIMNHNMDTMHQFYTNDQSRDFFQPNVIQSTENGYLMNNMRQSQAHSPNRSRARSLDPSSAVYGAGQQGGQWSHRGHSRAPSDAISDTSSHPSPYITGDDSFEPVNSNNSLFSGHQQGDGTMQPDTFGLDTFTLSEPQYSNQQQQHVSPGHSLHSSPHLSPQQHMPQFSTNENFGMLGPQQYQVTQQQTHQYGADAASPSYFGNQENFPGLQQGNDSPDMSSGGPQMTPAINIDLAPDKQPQNQEIPRSHRRDSDALSPPARHPSRTRGRAISDPYASSPHSSRSPSPSRPRGSSLGLPGHARSLSRPSSPGPANGIQKVGRERTSSMSSLDQHRDRMLELADPYRQDSTPPAYSSGPSSEAGSQRGASPTPSSTGSSNSKRIQKHPATFQCSLCPKRFTRAYNLRSHLRTHTDERPFVCTVCGKAFARQHDRKRHEGLHSGEKKFVCKGLLGGGQLQENGQPQTWGCGRRFARADALGRHFRSEAGRTCIRPLLDEEARERQAAMMEQHNQEMMNAAAQGGMAPQQQPGMGVDPAQPLDVSGITLPAALLAQYPALAGIQWDALPPAGAAGVDDGGDVDFDGRSSFDASSGGEWDVDDELGGSYDPGLDPAATAATGMPAAQNWHMGVDQAQGQQAAHGMGMAGGGMWQQGGGMGYGGR